MGCVNSKAATVGPMEESMDTKRVSPSSYYSTPTPASSVTDNHSNSTTSSSVTSKAKFYDEVNRLKAAGELGCLNPDIDPRFSSITTLMSSIFKVPVALVTVLGQCDCYFKSNHGLPGVTSRPRNVTFCEAIMTPDDPEVLIVEDALLDARFSQNPGVVTEPYMRFYAGAPLVGSDGYRYGTLCVVDYKPRRFPAGLYNTLMNFAELVVREMERDRILEMRAQSYEQAQELLRSPAAYKQAVALVNTARNQWDILFANPLWATAMDTTPEKCLQDTLWDQYCLTDSAQSTLLENAIVEGHAVDVQVLRLKDGGNDVDDLRPITLTLQPAAVDALEIGVPVGIPNFIISNTPRGSTVGLNTPRVSSVSTTASASTTSMSTASSATFANTLWFAVLQQGGDTSAQSQCPVAAERLNNANLGGELQQQLSPKHTGLPDSPTFAAAANNAAAEPILTVPQQYPYERPSTPPKSLKIQKMGALVGSGASSRVYRARRDGKEVAVKVMDLTGQPAEYFSPFQIHATLSGMQLDHPHLLKIYDFAIITHKPGGIRPMTAAYAPGQAIPGNASIWISKEYCNKGMLNDACERGWFKHKRVHDGVPNMKFILRTAAEIAGALKFLHSLGVVHGVNSKNILLTTSQKDDRGFQAMLGSSSLNGLLAMKRSRLGTVSHMSPELLLDGSNSPAADVYGFGVLLWEMYVGERAFSGMSPAEVVFLITQGQAVLPLPLTTPKAFKQLVQECLAYSARQRPTMDNVFDRLIELVVYY